MLPSLTERVPPPYDARNPAVTTILVTMLRTLRGAAPDLGGAQHGG